ncbi:hypothetical protein DPMN_057442 [Dreissena polymorpha]|uniref:Uncharacterized protein n=1 Tax=Dreissena polymorpha TaxID=45954 RepID=A0A9D4BZZ5_DREPO|nr:hypothetical protein DPMN_057442 [Dreissena polymorpha]
MDGLVKDLKKDESSCLRNFAIYDRQTDNIQTERWTERLLYATFFEGELKDAQHCPT